MKNLLICQSSEYDCGPVSLINGVRYLFEREEIFPDLIKFIMLYCMDTYNSEGELCKRGTSAAAMNFITNWLNHFSETRRFPIHCEFLSGGGRGGKGRKPHLRGAERRGRRRPCMFFWRWRTTCF